MLANCELPPVCEALRGQCQGAPTVENLPDFYRRKKTVPSGIHYKFVLETNSTQNKKLHLAWDAEWKGDSDSRVIFHRNIWNHHLNIKNTQNATPNGKVKPSPPIGISWRHPFRAQWPLVFASLVWRWNASEDGRFSRHPSFETMGMENEGSVGCW